MNFSDYIFDIGMFLFPTVQSADKEHNCGFLITKMIPAIFGGRHVFILLENHVETGFGIESGFKCNC